jgi:hypothetical protein
MARSTRKFGPVHVERIDPGRGWSLEQARDMVRDGYSAEHVSQVTGFGPQLLSPAVIDRLNKRPVQSER